MATTPMMQQYHDAKEVAGDALLLFRMGDFYELFYEDAQIAARVLGLTLTSRDKGENPIPMAGFPYHQLDGYLAKIIQAGHRAAVCEQVEDPQLAKGLVKREVTRVVTPGTLTDDALLDPKQSNYLAAVVKGGKQQPDAVGVAWAELSTGRFRAAVFPRSDLADQLARIAPSECLVSEDEVELADEIEAAHTLTRQPPWSFSSETALATLSRHFETLSVEGFGFGDADTPAIRAAGGVLEYLRETQRASLDHIEQLTPYHGGNSLQIDEATRRSLELTRTIRGGARSGSLLGVLDRTVTPMGSRMLAEWLSAPLTDIRAIDERLDAVEELAAVESVRDTFRSELRAVYDLERLLARVTTGRCSPRDLSFVARTLQRLPIVKQQLARCQSALLSDLEQQLELCEDLRDELTAALVESCPLTTRDGGFVQAGYCSELDQLRELAAGGKEWIAQYQAKIAAEIDVPNLKVGYNKVFGYYLELTNAHREKAPDSFIRKQTLKNAERFITPELKEYEEKVLAADERALELELSLFQQLRERVHAVGPQLRIAAYVLSQLDVLAGLAELARERGYCRPQVVPDPTLQIEESRHPVLDILESQGTFVPNDVHARPEEGMLLLITGPNMAGKSTYIRQVALLTVMAQMGSFVPAARATIGIADRVFARVGASDELSRGQSTFMVEMTETARILNTATSRSLVILDEIGRGTSTYDGLALAWAIVEHIHDRIGCRTLFATHYHELTELEKTLGGVRNLNVAVQEWEDKVAFLHKIEPGAADKSYGIHVAQLAGVPGNVNRRAKEVLAQLESDQERGHLPGPSTAPRRRSGELQLTLFEAYDHPLLGVIRETDLNGLTPIDALQRIKDWQDQLVEEELPKAR